MDRYLFFLFNRHRQAFFWRCFVAVSLLSCSKGNDDIVIPVPPATGPGNNTPTGTIQAFAISDSVVAFGYGATLKWLVNGSNSYTLVFINGVKVGIYGILDTGPLKQDTKFTLSLNNGQQASLTVKVFDSLSTALWNQGKGLKQTKTQLYLQGPANGRWVDTTISDEDKLRRIYFNFNGTTTIIRTGASTGLPVIDGGKFTTDIPTSTLTWGGVIYRIESLTGIDLTLKYAELQSNGIYITRRNYYRYE